MPELVSVADWYMPVKLAHVSFVALSGVGFLMHGVLMWRESPRRHGLWFRYGVHVVDSLLLLSAILLAMLTRQMPWEVDWLGTKILLLLAYIVCGAIALKRGPTMAVRRIFLFIAAGVFAQIVAVALTRDALGLLRWL